MLSAYTEQQYICHDYQAKQYLILFLDTVSLAGMRHTSIT